MNILQKYYTRIILSRNKRSYNAAVIIFLVILLFVMVFISIGTGPLKIPLSEILSSLQRRNEISKAYRIISFVRIPRTLAAVLSGCALSVSGVILQSVLNNSLASPSVIGVNSGAGLFVVLIAAFFPASLYFTAVGAFIGAMIAVLLVYYIAQKTGASRMAIVLSGIAVSSFIGAMTDTALTLKPEAAIDRIAFLIGGFSGITIDKVSIAAGLIIFAFAIAVILSYDMNVLALGDESAISLGLNVARLRFVFLILASILAGSSISIAGLLGFIGLIVPHVSRFLVGYDNRILLPVSALLGGIFTLLCDLLARVLFAPYEIPVGIIISFLGGPFFVFLLIKGKRGQLYD